MKSLRTYLSVAAAIAFACNAFSQSTVKLDKVSHAEPLYLDLVRDLGARKGEKEFNVGVEYANFKNYNEHASLFEYEFAPVNRLGVEMEADFSFIERTRPGIDSPSSKIKCLRFSTQYSFFVSPKLKTTLAAGYTHIIEFADFKNYGRSTFITGTVHNPFFIAAKRWGENFHSIVYTGPLFGQDFINNSWAVNGQINTSLLYTFPHTKHFIGVEVNQEANNRKFETTIRPQVKIRMNKKLAIGIVAGIPVNNPSIGNNLFLRIIYEP